MRKPLAVLVIGLLVAGLLALTGCGKEEPVEETVVDTSRYAGRYVSEEDPSDYIEIMPNNTFFMTRGGEAVSGSCDVEGGELRLSSGSFSEDMEIGGGVITDSEGNRFVKSSADDSRSDDKPRKGHETPREAIEAYCDENGIDMPDLTVSGEKEVSAQDPAWEISYAFPAEAEGTGEFFLLHDSADGWLVVAHTEGGQTGWSTGQLEALGAPADLAEQQD